MKLNLQDYASVAEVIGAVAVVISLVYVALSIRQNTDAIQVSNHQALVAMDMEKNSWLRESEFAEIYVIAREEPEKLSKVQMQQYSTFVADTMNAWEFAYITYSNGAMDETIWHGWDGFYRSELSSDLFRRFWLDRGEGFSPKFKAYVDSIVREQDDGA
ncbi:MAG: hypothetical protein H6993_11970 [Pseudomonadales bacterium]|nr:hypothetical protein [Pseudomonadales bacterium]